KAEEDDTIDVGSVIAIIGEEGESAGSSDASADEKKEETPAEESASDESSSEESAPAASGDATDVEMPELGESVTEGTITQWLKSVGDTADVAAPLLEVSTDKVDTAIPSPVAGTLVETLADEDDTIDVGAVIARIGDGNAKPAASEKKEEPKAEPKEEAPAKEEAPKEEPKKEEPKQEAPKAEPKKEEAAPKASAKVNSGDNIPYVTPLVRKLADKHGIDLNTVEGTGVGGRIRKQDVLAAAEGGAESGSAAPAGERANWSTKSVDPAKQELIGTTAKVNRIREITASKMVESLHITAQLTHVQEVDMTTVAALRKK